MEAQILAQGTQDMLPAVGMYLMMASAAPGAIYIGNYLLHAKTPGYRTKLFPSGKPGLVIGLILGSLFFICSGYCLFFSFQSRECYKSQIDRAKKNVYNCTNNIIQFYKENAYEI